jgi:peptide deformylase
MSVLQLVYWPSRVLAQVSEPVSFEEQASDEFKKLVADMIETMRVNNGVGLAAIQVGVPKRVFIALAPFNGSVRAYVNPQIEELIDEPALVEEGCLSVPGYSEKVLRHPEVIISAQEAYGARSRFLMYGIEAQCAQHEIEHLDGKVFVDGAGTMKRDIIRRKIHKALTRR